MYSRGSSAYQLELPYNPVEKVNKKVRARNRRNAKTMITILLGLGICLFMCYRYAAIYGNSVDYAKKESGLRDIEARNTQLVMEIERSVDLKSIEEYAINELGMVRPQRYQIRYVTPQVEDKMEKTDNGTENYGGIFGAIGEYLR